MHYVPHLLIAASASLVRLLACPVQARRRLLSHRGSFPLGSSFVGALLATKSYDLRGVANRTILHVAAGHPSLREGERNFFVLRWRGLGASCRD